MIRSRSPAIAVLFMLGAIACDDDPTPTQNSPPVTATVRLVFRGATTRRTDLPPSANECVQGVGATHTHPSWRNFDVLPLQAVPPDRYELAFNDVPTGTSVSLRVNDQNWCDVNPTGAVLRGVFANDVELAQNAMTPGNGQEPGFAFMVDSSERVRQ